MFYKLKLAVTVTFLFSYYDLLLRHKRLSASVQRPPAAQVPLLRLNEDKFYQCRCTRIEAYYQIPLTYWTLHDTLDKLRLGLYVESVKNTIEIRSALKIRFVLSLFFALRTHNNFLP